MHNIEHPASNSASAPRPQVESVGTLEAITVTVVEWLLPVFGSGVVETTVAVLTTCPDELGPTTTSVMVAEPPLAIVPREQITALVKEQDPCVDVAETYVAPAGKMSVTVTLAAEPGPPFATARL
jgi:hypothetical protein